MQGMQLYGIPTGNIAIGASARITAGPLQIENAYDFIWLDGTYSCDVAAVQAGNDTTHGGFLINVLPAAGQEKAFKDQVPIAHVFRNIGLSAGGDRRLPFAMRFQAGGAVSLDVTNLIAGGQNLRITFLGIRVPPNVTVPIQIAGATVQV